MMSKKLLSFFMALSICVSLSVFQANTVFAEEILSEQKIADEGHDVADNISEDHERHIGLFLLGVLIIAGLAGGKAIAVRKKAQTQKTVCAENAQTVFCIIPALQADGCSAAHGAIFFCLCLRRKGKA